VSGLVLCSTASVFTETRSDRFFFESILGSAVKALDRAPKFLVDRLPGRFRSPDKSSPLAAWMATEYQDHNAALIAQAGRAVGRFRSDHFLPHLGIPVSVVVTTEDGTVPPSRQHQLTRLIPDVAEFSAPLDHRAAVTDPETYWPVLDAALASVARRQKPLVKGAIASRLAAAQARETVQHLFVSGRVQGVGFRDSMQRRAQELGVHGWVRNRRDGRVEAIVAGGRERVDELLEWARSGPPLASVSDVTARARTITELRRARASDTDINPDRFEVRPTE
jgi:acylphosphatase